MIFINIDCSKSNKSTEKIWPERLRGVSISALQNELINDSFFSQMANWGVNVITIDFQYDEIIGIKEVSNLSKIHSEMDPYRKALNHLDKIVTLAKKNNIFIVLQISNSFSKEKNDAEITYIKSIIDLYVYLGVKYLNEPTLLAFSFLARQHTPWIVENWQTKVVPDFIKAVREVDDNTYFIFSAGLWGFPEFGTILKEPFKDPANKTLYGWHDYSKYYYSNNQLLQKPKNQINPDKYETTQVAEQKLLNRDSMYVYIQPAIEFMKKYDVKMYVGEFGFADWVPDVDKLLVDKISLFEKNGISWATNNFGSAFNLNAQENSSVGGKPDKNGNIRILNILRKYFKKNKIFNE